MLWAVAVEPAACANLMTDGLRSPQLPKCRRKLLQQDIIPLVPCQSLRRCASMAHIE